MKKLISFLAYFALSMVVFISFAFAYIDPSAMTYLIQIIASIVIACGAALGFYWRKLKRSVRRKKEKQYGASDEADDADCTVEYVDEEDIIDPNSVTDQGAPLQDGDR